MDFRDLTITLHCSNVQKHEEYVVHPEQKGKELFDQKGCGSDDYARFHTTYIMARLTKSMAIAELGQGGGEPRTE